MALAQGVNWMCNFLLALTFKFIQVSHIALAMSMSCCLSNFRSPWVPNTNAVSAIHFALGIFQFLFSRIGIYNF